MKPERRIFEFDNIKSICEAHSKFFDSCRETHLKCRAEYCPIWGLGQQILDWQNDYRRSENGEIC